MANLFAFRATDPKVMMNASDPIGPDNNAMLLNLNTWAGVVVAAWGTLGGFLDRDIQVRKLLKGDVRCLGETKEHFPRHPLYVKADKELELYL